MGTLPLHVYTPDPTMPVPVIFKHVTGNVDTQSCVTITITVTVKCIQTEQFCINSANSVGSCSSSPNPKSQFVQYPNHETTGNNDKQWCVIVFCNQWENTLHTAPILLILLSYPPQLNITALFSLDIITEDIINDDHCYSIEGRKWVVVCYHYYYY